MISIITPVRNGANHIEACLRNVISQRCPDVEHIVVDGNSDDNTIDIVKQYAASNDHIRWISETDRGQSDAMNKGLSMARGDIIGILNVDDYYEPGTLGRIASLFHTMQPPGLAVGNCNVWNNAGELLSVNKPCRLRIEDLLLGWRINPHPVNPSAYFYHKSLHEIIGPYDENEHFAMDIDFIFKAIQTAHVHYSDEIWGNYRLLDGTKTVVDRQRGSSARRVELLFTKYRRQLPLWKQLKIDLMKVGYQSSAKARVHLYRLKSRIKDVLDKKGMD
jgi:glycosyltransferase involved in cell wall biosynthesis